LVLGRQPSGDPFDGPVKFGQIVCKRLFDLWLTGKGNNCRLVHVGPNHLIDKRPRSAFFVGQHSYLGFAGVDEDG
jgi:hypothetical protein